MTQGRKTGMLPYGNGCSLYPDCFTCPLPDCFSPYGANRKAQAVLLKRWQPYIATQLNEGCEYRRLKGIK